MGVRGQSRSLLRAQGAWSRGPEPVPSWGAPGGLCWAHREATGRKAWGGCNVLAKGFPQFSTDAKQRPGACPKGPAGRDALLGGPAWARARPRPRPRPRPRLRVCECVVCVRGRRRPRGARVQQSAGPLSVHRRGGSSLTCCPVLGLWRGVGASRGGWGSDLHIHTVGRAETGAGGGSLFSAQLEVTHVTAPIATTPSSRSPGGAERGHPMPPALASRQPKAAGT